MEPYVAIKPNAGSEYVTVHSTKLLKGIDFAFALVENGAPGFF